MRSSRLVIATALGALSLVAVPRTVRAQGQLTIELPGDVPFPAAPLIVVRATGFSPTTAPRRIRLRLALDNSAGLVLFDSTETSDSPRFTVLKLLPENRDIFAEATVFDRDGAPLSTTRTFAGHTGARLEILSPNAPNGVTFTTRRPTFTWRSAKVSTPPGQWVYELIITEASTNVKRSFPGLTDTIFTVPVDLEASDPFRWSVVARLLNGLPADSAVAVGISTFTIVSPDAVVKTLLYQNFPNPFPAPSSQSTCFWFDLKSGGKVELTIHDLRGHRVRTIIPGALSSELDAGRYGRSSVLTGSGCDPRLQWDGTADDGRIVPAGVYLLRFVANGQAETMKKILFLGR